MKSPIPIKPLIPFAIFGILLAHFIWATVYFIQEQDYVYLPNTFCDGYGFYIILFCFISYGMAHVYIIKPFLSESISQTSKSVTNGFKNASKNIKYMNYIIYIVIFCLILGFLLYDSWGTIERLIPMVGLVLFLFIGFVFSKYRSKIKWDTIIRGLILQFLFGLITLRWEDGRRIFQCAGDKVTTFLDYAKNGSQFVYGDLLVQEEAVFAFSAITTIYFLAFVINILYHLGIMQKIVVNLGLFLRAIMGTSICESVNSAGNIFLGQTEAPLLLKPYLSTLTTSELHAVMTAGFASTSGTVFAAYISYGANAAHLITASVMAAPAGLVYSKLMYPETEETVATKESISLTKSEFSSVLEAASQGASQATNIILAIISSLIAFISAVNCINGILSWLSELVGFSGDDLWTVELIVGYIFTPISYLMGVPWEECFDVGKIIGIKMVVNEFAAFQQFQTVDLSDRAKVIATFAICGFANPGSLGIVISAFSTLIPNKSAVVSSVAVRAFVSGSIVCFTTACIAGMLSV